MTSSVFAQETITITTYYPAPFGVYQELRSRRMAIGETYVQQSIHPWATTSPTPAGEIAQGADLVVEGNVGIGTINPQARLHLWGEGNHQPRLRLDGEDGPGLDFYNGTIRTAFIELHEPNMLLNTDGAGYIAFRTQSSERMVITSDGNVGIGTNDPRAKLDVAGEVKIGNTGLACSVNTAGAMRYNSGNMEYCDGSSWRAVGFSAPDYESPWTNITSSSDPTFTHNLGTMNYMVYLEGNNLGGGGTTGIHNKNNPGGSDAAWFYDKQNNSVKVHRHTGDTDWDQVKVRCWKY